MTRMITDAVLQSTNGSGTFATGTTLTYTFMPRRSRQSYTVMMFVRMSPVNGVLSPTVRCSVEKTSYVQRVSRTRVLVKLNLLDRCVKTKLARPLGRKLLVDRAVVLTFPLNRLFELIVTPVRRRPQFVSADLRSELVKMSR